MSNKHSHSYSSHKKKDKPGIDHPEPEMNHEDSLYMLLCPQDYKNNTLKHMQHSSMHSHEQSLSHTYSHRI